MCPPVGMLSLSGLSEWIRNIKIINVQIFEVVCDPDFLYTVPDVLRT